MSLLSLAQVTRSFDLPDGDRLEILKGIDLQIEPGTKTSIVGRSGSGKSTLLNLLGLLDAPTSGEITFMGKSLKLISEKRKNKSRGRDIGFVFQQFNLLHGRTALDNVVMPLLYGKANNYWNRYKLAKETLDRVGLTARMETKVDNLSGGEQQRVAIARALVSKPKLILSDEPTGALDIETGNNVMNLLEEVSAEAGTALVTITHDVNIAARAEIKYQLQNGVLVPIQAAQTVHSIQAVPSGTQPGLQPAAMAETQLERIEIVGGES